MVLWYKDRLKYIEWIFIIVRIRYKNMKEFLYGILIFKWFVF